MRARERMGRHGSVSLCIVMVLPLSAACLLPVDLGEPGEASPLHLVATAYDEPLDAAFGSVKLRALASGDLLACSDRECVTTGASSRLTLPPRAHIEDVQAPSAAPGRLLIANDGGLSLCGGGGRGGPGPGGGADCEPQEESEDGAQPHAFAEHTAAFGLAPLSDGTVMFATSSGVGLWQAGSDRHNIVTYYADDTFLADAPVIGSTRVPAWLRLSRFPFACVLDRVPDGGAAAITCSASVALASSVSQVASMSAGRVAIATIGSGVTIFDGNSATPWDTSTGLPSDRVFDVITWQGAFWAATDRGLARYAEGTGKTELPSSDGLGSLANAPIGALAVLSDGSLAVYGGKPPAKLYRVIQDR